MNSKQRVHAALRREPVDRIPVFMWFHPETRTLLADLFEVPPAYVDVVLGNDVRMTWVNNNYAMEGVVHEHDGQSHVDYWGIKWVEEGPYNQVVSFPLAGASRAEVRRATRRLIDGMTCDGGGYILAASHTIPPETPVDNIFAM